jgi:hypothetical protein
VGLVAVDVDGCAPEDTVLDLKHLTEHKTPVANHFG